MKFVTRTIISFNSPKNSKQPVLYLNADIFEFLVFPVWLPHSFEAHTKQCAEALPEKGAGLAEKLPDERI